MEDLTYEAALAELAAIQAALENNEVGIEQLAAQVKRAYALLNFCRQKLREASDQVEQIIQEEKA
jgi:exodeoxyribonuclease VII small subunit